MILWYKRAGVETQYEPQVSLLSTKFGLSNHPMFSDRDNPEARGSQSYRLQHDGARDLGGG